MSTPLRVLLVEDDENDVELIARALATAGYAPEIRRVETATQLREALTRGPWDVVLADYQLPAFDGITALHIVKQADVDLPVVLVSGAIGEEAAVAAMREGAHDYVFKGNLRRLGPVVERELSDAALRMRYRQAETALLEASPEAMVVIAPDGLVLRANRRTQELFGYSSEELLGQPFLLLFPSLGSWNTSGPFELLEEATKSGTRDFRARRKNAEEFAVEVTLTPFASKNGVALIVAVRDMSERRKTLDNLARRADELAEANEALRAEQRGFPSPLR